jgi:hypothetical protein
LTNNQLYYSRPFSHDQMGAFRNDSTSRTWRVEAKALIRVCSRSLTVIACARFPLCAGQTSDTFSGKRTLARSEYLVLQCCLRSAADVVNIKLGYQYPDSCISLFKCFCISSCNFFARYNCASCSLEAARQCMDIYSKANTHLRESIRVIENYATGDAVQFMVSTDGKTIHGQNRGLGWRTRQVGGHMSSSWLLFASSLILYTPKY